MKMTDRCVKCREMRMYHGLIPHHFQSESLVPASHPLDSVGLDVSALADKLNEMANNPDGPPAPDPVPDEQTSAPDFEGGDSGGGGSSSDW